MNIPITLTKQQWRLIVRTLRGGPKKQDADTLTTLIEHIEQELNR